MFGEKLMAGFFTSQELKSNKLPTKLPQCGKCGLFKNCISPKMEVYGTGEHRILFVGEAPGETEDKLGIPFIGTSGQILRNTLLEFGFDLEDCWSTNSVICKPHNNKIEPYIVSCCRPNLLKTIEKLKPNVIIPLGSSALRSLLLDLWKKDVGPIERWVGWTIPVEKYNSWICPTYHPAFLLHNQKDVILHSTFKKHLEKAIELESIPPAYVKLSKLQSQVKIIKSTKKARNALKKLNGCKGIVAWDYETTGLKPDRRQHKIVSVSFCLNGTKTFAFMMNDKLKPYLTKVLQNSKLKKVASNLKYEERWTISKLGHKVNNWFWDTMLAAHCLDNRKEICSVKFQAFILFGIADYDDHIHPYLISSSSNGINKIEQLDKEELLLYNGLDSLLEYMVMEKQREIMFGEVYDSI